MADTCTEDAYQPFEPIVPFTERFKFGVIVSMENVWVVSARLPASSYARRSSSYSPSEKSNEPGNGSHDVPLFSEYWKEAMPETESSAEALNSTSPRYQPVEAL